MSHDSEDSDSMIMSLKDWRQALKSPPAYRIGNSTLRIQTKIVTILVVFTILVLLFLYYALPRDGQERVLHQSNEAIAKIGSNCLEIYRGKIVTGQQYYNSTYPLTKPIRTPTGINFRIAVVSDLDTESKLKDKDNTWISYLQRGYLSWNPALNDVRVSWDTYPPIKLTASLSMGGRGMELSELIVFNGKLYSVDDRTGVVYEIIDNKVVPWVVLADGNGRSPKGFKSEWATVKDQNLWIGGLGKEWTSPQGTLEHFNPQWIKQISPSGEVSHVYWRDNYLALRNSVGIQFPGYMIHESAVWSEIHKKWFFLPRRSSKEKYNEETDELMGTNIILISDEHFHDVKVTKVGEVVPSHGFSSFKFIPGTEDQVIVAIKSEELKGSVATYIMAFKINGQILMPETKIGDYKFEGIEFI